MTKDLRILGLSLFFWGLGEGLFIYFQPLYLDKLGADPIQIGGILGLTTFALTISHLPAGALADLVGRKPIMSLAWFGGAIAAMIMFLANSLTSFVAGMILYAFTGFVLSPLASYVTEAKGSWTVVRALTTISIFFNIGSIFGPIVGGQLGEMFGLRVIYGIATGVFTLSAILVLFIRPQPVERDDEGPRYQDLIKNKALGGFLILIFIAVFGMYLSWPLTPIFLQEERGVSVSSVGLFGSFNALGMVFLNLILGRLSPRLGFTIAQIAVGFSALILWRGTGKFYFSLGYYFAAGLRTARSLISALVETLVKRTELGLAFGLAETVSGLVFAIASPIAGLLYNARADFPFITSLSVIVISLGLTLRFAPRSAPKEPALGNSLVPGE